MTPNQLTWCSPVKKNHKLINLGMYMDYGGSTLLDAASGHNMDLFTCFVTKYQVKQEVDLVLVFLPFVDLYTIEFCIVNPVTT